MMDIIIASQSIQSQGGGASPPPSSNAYLNNLTSGFSFRRLVDSKDSLATVSVDNTTQEISDFTTDINLLGTTVELVNWRDQLGGDSLEANLQIPISYNAGHHAIEISGRNLNNEGVSGECLSVVLETSDTNAILFNKSWTRLMYLSQTPGATLQQGTGASNEYYVNGNLIANDRSVMIANIVNKGVVIVTVKNIDFDAFSGDFNINGFHNQSYGFSGRILELITAPNSEAENIIANQKNYYGIT